MTGEIAAQLPAGGGALAGVRVLDVSMYLPGPYCSLLLADLGADVIQVEPIAGELGRFVQPAHGDDSALHRWVARGKRSLALDLKNPHGIRAFLELAAGADVVLEGFAPGVADRLGIGFEACRATNGDVVYCAISGPGAAHAAAGPGHDIDYMARAGALADNVGRDGDPVAFPLPVVDVSAGLHAAVGILAALRHRDASGEGQFIDVSMMGAALALAGPQLVKALAPEPLPKERDSNLGADPAYRAYRTGDERYLVIGAYETKFWERLCDILGRPDLVPLRQWDPESAAVHLSAVFATRTLAHWVELLDEAGVCFAPVNTMAEVAGDPLVTARGDLPRDADGFHQILSPIRMSAIPVASVRAAPALDQGGARGWLRSSGDPRPT